MVRLLDEGGMILESDKQYKSLDELLDYLEKKLPKREKSFGSEPITLATT